MDWNPCFRIGVLNTFIPLALIAVSVAIWLASSTQDMSRVQAEAAEEVAHLSLESSNFYGATMDSRRSHRSPAPATASEKVVQTENAVVIDEALTIKDELYTYTQAEVNEVKSRQKSLCELVGSGLLVVSYLVGISTTSADWEPYWLALWTYFFVISLVSFYQHRSFFLQKLLVTTVASLVTLCNLRTSILISGAKGLTPMTAIQAALAIFLLGCNWLSSFTQPLSSEMDALYETMHKRKLYTDVRTAMPTPPLAAQHNAEDIERITPSYSKGNETLYPPPEQHASLLSRALFMFAFPTIWKHYFKPITLPDVPQLMPIDRSASVISMFRIHNGPETKRSLWARLMRHFAPRYAYQALFALFATLLSIAPILFLSYLLDFFTIRTSKGTEGAPWHMGVLYASGMFFSQVLFSICQSQALMTGRHICVQIRAALTFEVLSKMIRRGMSMKKPDEPSEPTKKDESEDGSAPTTDGAVMNLVSVDVNKLSEMAAYMHFIFPQQPLTLILGMIYIVMLLGWSAVVGLFLLVVAVPIQAYISRLLVSIGHRMLRATDERLNLASEVLACIKTVKFFAWEASFEKRMNDTRSKELALLRLQYVFLMLNLSLIHI